MGGLLVIGLFLSWLGVAIWLARRSSRRIKMKASLRPFASVAFTVLIFFMPVADELAARPYFEWLCHRNTVVQLDAQQVKGRRVRLTVEPAEAPVSGTPVPVFRSHYVYRDTLTNRVLVQHDVYRADGGLLSRLTGFVSSHPLTGTFYCAPENQVSMQAEYDFVIVN